MIAENIVKTIELKKSNCSFKFLESGDVFEFLYKDIMINTFQGTDLYGSVSNIYLRIYENGIIKNVFKLLGINSKSKISYNEDSILFIGENFGISYKVKFTLNEECIWFYEVFLEGDDKEIDLIYLIDLSISNKNAILSNELYMSQYLHHEVIQGENGYTISTRQNQEQNGCNPYVQIGSLNKRINFFSTDGMQFFGKKYKNTNEEEGLFKNLENKNYQYELSTNAIQTLRINLNGSDKVVFYGIFKEHLESKIENILFLDEIKKCYENLVDKNNFKEINKIKLKDEFDGCISSENFTIGEIYEIYPKRIHEEFLNGKMLSFFLEDNTHVVLKEKEILMERPHGNIIIDRISKEKIDTNIISSTNYMFGVFSSQLVIGNTNLNKFTSVNRGLLNILKNTGQRIYIKINGKFKMLTLSGIYELYGNSSVWYYKIEDDILIIKSYVSFEKNNIILEIDSKTGKNYEFIITNQLVMGSNEFENSCNLELYKNIISIYPDENSFLKSTYKNINYKIKVLGCNFSISDDSIFFDDNTGRNKTLLTIKTSTINSFKIIINGNLNGDSKIIEDTTFEIEKSKFKNYYKDLTNNFNLSIEGDCKYNLNKLNTLFFWYTHNALIHYASPHGLEQSGGAAWGTRDVCQGPFEYFIATRNYKLLREIILKVFTHQFLETGDFPQWFMFDNYVMQQDNSHGDVIFWPLKIIGDYLELTGDDSILNEKIGYRNFPSGTISNERETLFNHIIRAINNIESRFIYNTKLVSYGGGDWDDTLQPANKDLSEKMVSSWTVALSYQVFLKLSNVLIGKELKDKLKEICKDIHRDFYKYGIKDGVIAGFIHFEDEDNFKYILHTSDNETNIKYRLLPMIRGLISEIIDVKDGEKIKTIIEENLTFSDGVRLMDNPPPYLGGIIKFFKRAEQATNIGREISLQYVHAHIRFIESMCKLKDFYSAFDGLYKIMPINLKEHVKNASLRQSNTYFSSSDGEFNDRYDFRDNFNKLKTCDVKVRGGWRIYSSGPGIYINQLISNILGIRILKDEIIFDPTLSQDLNGLKFIYKILDKNVCINYVIKENMPITNIIVNGTNLEFSSNQRKYKDKLAIVKISKLKELLYEDHNIIEIKMG